MLLLQGRTVLSSKGIVVKFTAAIFFPYGGLISTQIGRWSSLLVERVRAKKRETGESKFLLPSNPFFARSVFCPPSNN